MSGRPRVGVLYPTRTPGSEANWSGTPAGLARGLRARGAEVVLIGTGGLTPRHLAFAAGERLRRRDPLASRTRGRQQARTRLLAAAVETAGALDLLVAMGTDTYDLATVRPRGVPTVTYDDATLVQQWRDPCSAIRGEYAPDVVEEWFEVQRRSSAAADLVCVSSEWAAESFVGDYGVAPECVAVVGMGHRARGVPEHRDLSRPRFLFVGLDWRRKNGDAVLRAFAEVRRSRPDAHLDVVGGHPPLAQPGVTGHGRLRLDDASDQRRLDDLFARATVFVLPSHFEPFGIVYLEAASAGLPVVGTVRGGAATALADGARAVDPHDHDALVAAMTDHCDPQVALAAGGAAARQARRFTWEAVAARVLERAATLRAGERQQGTGAVAVLEDRGAGATKVGNLDEGR